MPHNPNSLSPALAPAQLTGWQAYEREDASLAVREVLGRTPAWILRSGTTVVASLVGVLLLLSWIIHYPDTVNGKVTITGATPSLDVVARQSGQLERLCVSEGETVDKGRLLGVIKNPASTERVLRLKAELNKLRSFLEDPSAFVTLNIAGGGADLGTVQAAYGDFHSRYQHYATLLQDDFATKSIGLLQRQLEAKRAQLVQMQRQAEAARRQSELADINYKSMQQLQGRDSISRAELQMQERQMLEQRRTLTSVEKSMLEEQVAVTEGEKQIIDMTHKRNEDLRIARTDLSESYKKLLAGIEAWENDYVLRAPADGTVAFYDFWADQQFVTQGKSVFIIAPKISQLLGRIPVQQGGAGKIKPGQTVRIKLNDFPSREFGMVSGKVKSVSLVAQQGQQLVSVSLDYPLVSSYGRKIPFKQEMVGDAVIITEDSRVIGRLFGEIRKAWSQSAN